MASQRVVPRRLLDAGFTFADGQLADALAAALDDRVAPPIPRAPGLSQQSPTQNTLYRLL